MKSRNTSPNSIRAVGQRTIASTFLFRPPLLKPCAKYKEGESKSKASLTSFLNNIHTTSVLPIHKVEEERLSIPLDQPNVTRERRSFEKPREGRTCVIEESVFKLFNSSEEKGRKRSAQCLTAQPGSQGYVNKDSQKHLLVLGDDPKPKRRPYRQVSHGKEKPRPLYNHYENGTGWWDSDREGIDNDAVGHKEVWEGVGSTTLGGLDWC